MATVEVAPEGDLWEALARQIVEPCEAKHCDRMAEWYVIVRVPCDCPGRYRKFFCTPCKEFATTSPQPTCRNSDHPGVLLLAERISP